MREKLLSYLENQTDFIDLVSISEVFTANKLADIFQVKRNTISHYLNQLQEEGDLVKINSRPVYYFHKKAFEKQFYPLESNFYPSIEMILKEQPLFEKKQDFFSLLIGFDQSLSQAIRQVKTALYYPDNGLPVLFTGASGTGKSYLVKLIYQYCLSNDLITEEAPFVTLNCAQYANNPELLTSNLFGHVKGAYTGAESDKKGAFEAANQGILFLDEVHRLNAEGQEKLFTFLDQGIIYRMGDTNQPIQVATRIFFATTEELDSSFLTTFLRRIPVQIALPPLEKRSKSERLELIYSFLIHEQKKVKRELIITGQTLNALASGEFKGNIGELKNVVKVMVAKSFAEQSGKRALRITLYDLPRELLTSRTGRESLLGQEEITINATTTMRELIDKSQPKQKRTLEAFAKIVTSFQQNHLQLANCHDILKQEVDHLFDFLLFETNRQKNHELLIYMTQYIRETLKQMESAYQIRFNGNSVYAISYYLFQRSNRYKSEDIATIMTIKKLEEQVAQVYPLSYRYVNRILELCQAKLDLDLTEMDRILLTIYLKQVDWTKDLSIPRAIIIAHGYATASSIANVVNRLLGKDIFEAFDMPLDITPQKIAEEVLDYCESHDVSQGLVIMVDMGSLKEIYQYFPKQITTPIVIMNNVTTPLALAVGENMQKMVPLPDLVTSASQQASFDWEMIYPNEKKAKALITTCFTSIGTATQIAHLLEKSLPLSSELKIYPYEYELLREKKQTETIFSMYEVLGIIGTANPCIPGTPYLSLEELISGIGMETLTNWLEQTLTSEEQQYFNDNIIRNFSLEKVINSVTILNTEKIMAMIELFMHHLATLLQLTLTNAQKLALYVHVSCLIERLIRNVPIESYAGYVQLYQCQKERLIAIKEAFSVIEKNYSVKIPDSELAYIYDILFSTFDKSTLDEEF